MKAMSRSILLRYRNPRWSAYKEAILASEPILYWRLGEQAGTRAIDLSGNQYDGVYTSGITLGVTGALTDDPNTAADLNSASDSEIVDSGLTPSDLGFAGSASRSIEVWAFTRSWTDGGIYSSGITGTAGQDFSLRPLSTGQANYTWRVQIWGAADLDFDYNSLNKWAHFVVTYDGTTLRAYADGVLQASKATAIDTAQTGTLRLGQWRTDYFNGVADELAVYNRALTGSEISDHYDVGA